MKLMRMQLFGKSPSLAPVSETPAYAVFRRLGWYTKH